MLIRLIKRIKRGQFIKTSISYTIVKVKGLEQDAPYLLRGASFRCP